MADEEYLYEPSRLAATGPVIDAGDRTVRVLERRERPTIAVLADAVTAEECAALMEFAGPLLREATVVDYATGEARLDPGRRCAMHHLRRDQNEWVERIDRRLARIMGMPVEHGEGLQIQRYQAGGEYQQHQDYFAPRLYGDNAPHLRVSGQRLATLIVYLNDVAAGGETYFPRAGVQVQPRRGTAVYFEYCNSLGQLDAQTLHGGAPVLQGEKWIATKWMRQRPWPQKPRPEV